MSLDTNDDIRSMEGCGGRPSTWEFIDTVSGAKSNRLRRDPCGFAVLDTAGLRSKKSP